MKREENMKFWNKKKLNFIFFNIEKIHKKFKQHSINIKNYTAHPHDMVHVPAKFREKYIDAFLSYSAKTKRDGRTDVWYAVGLCIVGLILKYAVGLLKVFSRT